MVSPTRCGPPLYKFRGNAEGSTLRLSLGCLLDLELRRVGSGKRLTFGQAGEAKLSQWMADNARVCWVEHDEPWTLESLPWSLPCVNLIAAGYLLPLTVIRSNHRRAWPGGKAMLWPRRPGA
ncbi:GIY-YIG nuclease family protein [Streptomyces sp. NPDC096032]|uniref:GIY-YIG nuclease family protein n=1 Tax=Streptomyces sp. NPDC096032 TaxID=3366070 RepID=UPI0038067C0C